MTENSGSPDTSPVRVRYRAVSSQTQHIDHRDIDDHIALELQSLGYQHDVGGSQNQFMDFDQVAESENAAFIGKFVFTGIEPDELAKQGHIVTRRFPAPSPKA